MSNQTARGPEEPAGAADECDSEGRGTGRDQDPVTGRCTHGQSPSADCGQGDQHMSSDCH